MLEVKSSNGTVDILQMDSTEGRLVGDIEAAAHETLLLIANNNAKSEEAV